MSARPKEIQQLIEWLRVPGRELPCGWGTSEAPCALHKLKELCTTPENAKRYWQFRLEDTLGVAPSFLNSVARVNDNTRDPLAVAAYLETEFPVQSS